MAGYRRAAARRRRERLRGALRRLLPAVAVSVAVLGAAPGTALTTTSSTTYDGFVYPFLDCSVHNTDGTWTVVFGYTNTGTTTISLPAGLTNAISPSPTYGSLPTSFAPGVHHGVFAVKVGPSSSPTWTLAGIDVTVVPTAATVCPAGMALPADGNGAGPAIVLVAAGALGGLGLVVARRRALAPSSSPEPEPEPEPDPTRA